MARLQWPVRVCDVHKHGVQRRRCVCDQHQICLLIRKSTAWRWLGVTGLHLLYGRIRHPGVILCHMPPPVGHEQQLGALQSQLPVVEHKESRLASHSLALDCCSWQLPRSRQVPPSAKRSLPRFSRVSACLLQHVLQHAHTAPAACYCLLACDCNVCTRQTVGVLTGAGATPELNRIHARRVHMHKR